MNLKEQLYVTTLARCKTISKASEELFITQPALSVYISNLEKYLGVKLFVRTGKEFVLTYAGEEYVKRARIMLQLKEEFQQIVHDITSSYESKLRLGIQHRRAVGLLRYILPRFTEQFPEVELSVREGIHSELVEMYSKNEIDLMLGIFNEEFPDSEYVDVMDERVLVVLPKDHPANKLAYKNPDDRGPWLSLDLKHLDKEPFVLPTKKQSLRRSIDHIFEAVEIGPGKVTELTYFETIMGLVESGVGVGFNREGYLDFMCPNPNLRYYLIGELDYTSKVRIIYKKGGLTEPAAKLAQLLKTGILEGCGLL